MTQNHNEADNKAPASPAPKQPSSAKTTKVSKPVNRAAKPKSNASSARSKVGLLWLLVLLLIVSVIGLGYMQWQAQSQRLALTSDQNGQHDDVLHWQQQQLALRQELNELRASTEAAGSILSDQQTGLATNQKRMDKALVDALETMAKTQLDQGQALPQWKLAEAEYLLRLANQRLAMEQASESAVALLKAADIIIRDSEQVGTYGIRRAIALDLAALTAVPSVDVEGVYAQLAALSALAGQLTFVPPRSEAAVVDTVPTPSSEPTPVANDAEQGSWTQSVWQGTKTLGTNVWGELKQLIKVQSRTQEDQQLLTPAAELLVRMRIEMALSQTQVALLRRQQTIYDQSLVGVEQLLGQYYRPSDDVVQAMHSQIDALEKVKVLVNMPNISGSLVALKGFIAALHDSPTEPAAGE